MAATVIRVGIRLGRPSIHVRSTPNSDRKVKALPPVVMCHKATYAVQQISASSPYV
jgi:hypothetical protein